MEITVTHTEDCGYLVVGKRGRLRVQVFRFPAEAVPHHASVRLQIDADDADAETVDAVEVTAHGHGHGDGGPPVERVVTFVCTQWGGELSRVELRRDFDALNDAATERIEDDAARAAERAT